MKKYLTVENILLVFVGIIALVFIVGFFKNKKDSGISYKELLAAKDSIIKYKDEVIEMKNQLNVVLDKTITEHEKKDSILMLNLLSNQKFYRSIDEKIKNIPIDIARIANNDDSIRAAFHNIGHN